MRITRRQVGKLAAGAALLPSLASRTASAAPAEVKIALIAPLSGPWARQGQLMRMGGEMAIDDINAAGGIKSLGGAKLKLVVGDTGDSAESAKNATQRLLSENPDLVGGTGAWLSSFTLAVTEVTERAELPWTTVSFADSIVNRGFHYIFQTSATSDAMAGKTIPNAMTVAHAAGRDPKTVGIVADSSASNVSFIKGLREKYLPEAHLTTTVDLTYTPPLADGTSLVQRVRAAKPDFLMLMSSNLPDDKLMLETLAEMGLGRGRLPIVSNGAHFATPELLKAAGAEALEGVMVTVGNWGSKGQEELIARFSKRFNEPWMTQDSISTYGDMHIFKTALEAAGVADRNKVAQAIRALDLTDGPALFYPGHRIKFDETGRRVGADMVIVQWQKGVPMTIYPKDLATTTPFWGKQG